MIPLAWILMWYGSRMYRTHEREKTRREIAAYIAEGSMSPEQGERLMSSGEREDA